tara:strand:+ start:423 stop:1088 length:666 start_codon:yes stop_codon:yes gene_type:complete
MRFLVFLILFFPASLALAMGARPDNAEIVVCELDGHVFHIPAGYMRYGGAALGCAPEMHTVLFNAYRPNLISTPSDNIRVLSLEERLLLQVQMSINTQYKNESKKNILDDQIKKGDKFAELDSNLVENLSYYEDFPEAYSLKKERRVFYYISKNNITHLLSCGFNKNRSDGMCSGSFTYSKFDVDYRYETKANDPILDISNQAEALIQSFYQPHLSNPKSE